MKAIMNVLVAVLLLSFTGMATMADAEQPKFKNPYMDAGKPVPADGGEAGKFFMTVFKLLVKKDFNQARKMLGKEEETDSMFYSDKNIQTLFCSDTDSTDAKIVGGFSTPDNAALYVEYTGQKQVNVELGKTDEGWRFSSCGTGWSTEE